MIIDIPDDLKGKERKRILDVFPVQYALEKFKGKRAKAAEWLGVSRRCVDNKIKNSVELKTFLRSKSLLRKEVDFGEKVMKVLESVEDIRETKFYQFSSEREKERIRRIIKEVL